MLFQSGLTGSTRTKIKTEQARHWILEPKWLDPLSLAFLAFYIQGLISHIDITFVSAKSLEMSHSIGQKILSKKHRKTLLITAKLLKSPMHL